MPSTQSTPEVPQTQPQAPAPASSGSIPAPPAAESQHQEDPEASDKLNDLSTVETGYFADDAPQTSSTPTPRKPKKRPSASSRQSQRHQTWSPAPRGLSARGRRHSSNTQTAQRPPLDPSQLTSLSIAHKEFNTHATVSPNDGRLHISVNKLKDGPATRRLFSTLNNAHRQEPTNVSSANDAAVIANVLDEEKEKNPDDVITAPPKLNIVIMVIGSRGDVQPFIAVAKVLKEQWGHRVRLATHGVFRDFVEGHGIEFFDVGGDPSELMAFMVKNPVSFVTQIRMRWGGRGGC